MSYLLLTLHAGVHRSRARFSRARRPKDSGQTTAEYALVLLAAGTIAMLVIAWAQGNNAIGGLFDAVVAKITSLIA